MAEQTTPARVPISDEQVLKEYMSRMSEARKHSSQWRTEAKELYDIRAGHQWSDEDKALIQDRYGGAYPTTSFNLTDKYVDAVTGLQINNRQEIRYYPREMGDVGVDEFATGSVKWCRDQSEAEDEETDSFGDVFLVGMAWIEHFVEDTEDPEAPHVAQERRDPLEMSWDPHAKKRNLVDRRWQSRRKAMSVYEYREQFGDEEEGGPYEEGGYEEHEGTVDHVEIPDDYDTGTQGGIGPSKVYVDDYQFYRLEKSFVVMAQFPEGELKQIYTSSDWRQTKKALDMAGIYYEAEEKQAKVFYRAKICRGKIMGKVQRLNCGGFTFEAITGKRDRNTNTWYGMGRVIKDPQMWVNKFFASILYTISTNAKGGLMAEEDAFEDQTEAESSWANPAAITWTAPGALTAGKIQPKPAAQYPQGLDRLMEFTLQLMPLTSGLNAELIGGLTGREQPGVLEAQRKQSAMSIIAWVFDAMRRYYKRSGKLMLSMIREYLTEGQLIRITGEQGSKYVPLMKDKMLGKYDLIVDEAPTSVNMRERVWATLERMIPLGAGLGAPPPKEVLDYAPIPSELAQKWKESTNPSPEQQKQTQEAQQLQKQAATATIAKDQSTAELNRAKAAEILKQSQSTDITDALTQAQTLKEAAMAGKIQAGG